MRDRKTLLWLVLAGTLLAAAPAIAQCPICRNSLINSLEGQKLASGFSSGIIFLLSAPFLIVSVVAFSVFKPELGSIFGRQRIGRRAVLCRAYIAPVIDVAQRARTDAKVTCKRCSASLGERQITLGVTTTDNGLEVPTAIYTCPMCRRITEVVPTLEELKQWELFATGAALQAKGRNNEALTCYQRALEISSGSAMAWYSKGCVLADLGRFEEAVQCYDCALSADPQDADAWHNKARALRALRRFEDALQCCNRALELNCERSITWNNKGDLLLAVGRAPEALTCYEEALAIDPTSGSAWLGLGCARAQLGCMIEALRCFDHALAIDPEDSEAWAKKGNVFSLLCEFSEAGDCYKRALKINPGDLVARHNRAVLLARAQSVQ